MEKRFLLLDTKPVNVPKNTYFGSTEDSGHRNDSELVKEAVRKTVEKYGQVLEKLADE